MKNSGYGYIAWLAKSVVTAIICVVLGGISASASFAASTISGMVTNGSVGIQGVNVSVLNGVSLLYSGGINTDINGNYSVSGLSAGSYKIRFTRLVAGYDNAWYSNQHDSLFADTIVLDGTNGFVANAVLTSGQTASISGKVTSDGVAAGIANVGVSASDATSGAQIAWTSTDSGGNYTFNGFVTGSYKVNFNGGTSGYQGGFYNGTTVPVSSYASAAAIPVTAPGGGATGINVTLPLAPAGAISGKVSNDTAVGIGGVQVNVWDYATNAYIQGVSTAGDGTYTVSGLPNGNYKVFVDGSAKGYNRLFYNNVTASGSATSISITTPAPTQSNINFTLAASANISGTVTNASDGITGIPSITVTPYDASSGLAVTNGAVTTDAQGKYNISGLTAGNYKLRFSGGIWVSAYYNDATSLATATPVAVTAGSTTTANMSLAPGTTISGKVTSDGTNGISGISIALHTSSGTYTGYSVNTDASGNYTFTGISSGAYKIRFNNGVGNGKYFVRRVNGGGLDFAHASSINVTVPAPVTGINGTLSPAGAISGTVTNAALTGISGITVIPYYSLTDTQVWNMNATTDASGNYTIGGLDPGSYRIQFGGTASAPILDGNFYNARQSIFTADQVNVSANTTTNSVGSVLTLPVAATTINTAGVTHKIKADLTEYDSFDVVINSYATTLSGLTLTVTGPAGSGFSYPFTNLDRISDSSRRLLLYKQYQTNGATPAPLPPGLYTFTLTDSLGNTDTRTDTHVTVSSTLPIVDSTTVNYLRKSDGSYRFSWTPVNGSYYYRIQLFLIDGYTSPIFASTRDANPFVYVPAGTMIDGLSYRMRVEVHDAPVYSQLTNRSDSAFVDFTPQPGDYRPITLTFAGTGSGSVNSNPAGIACSGNTCLAVPFNIGSDVTLMATADAGNHFTSWSIPPCATDVNGNCIVTMSGAQSVTATFDVIPNIKNGSNYYGTITKAFESPLLANNDTLLIKSGTFFENPVFNNIHGYTITMKGGYSDFLNPDNSGISIISGSLKIKNGTIKVEKITVK